MTIHDQPTRRLPAVTLSPRGDARKHDAGKPMWDLLPFDALEEVVQVLTFGAQKYGPHSWRTVVSAPDRYFAAALRHLVAHRRGERLDPETGISHLAHAACNVLFLLGGDITGWMEDVA